MKSADLRQSFLDYFQGHGHAVVPSSGLVPQNDPTLFFTNAGMVQFKDVFTGREARGYTRAASVQKCLRVSGKHNDLENVGRTARHHTFFEMLGNFSFGDYFKADAIPFAWDFLTNRLQIDKKRLWVTIFEEDDEAYDLWRSTTDVPGERIQRLGAKENFWSMGDTGPCGPCSEIHYDHGPNVSSETGGPATGDDRYVEIWNLVFMQFEQHADGTRTSLPRPSIDTGAGLERVSAVTQGVYNNNDTDGFQALIDRAAREAGYRYGGGGERDVVLKVIADHARAAAFLVADGVMPSNEGRGYVLRRVMRRAIRFGVKAEIDHPFFHLVTDEVAQTMGVAYPELLERRRFVEEVVRGEEERFRRTIDRGSKLLDAEVARAGRGGTIPGDVAFELFDTHGFPYDLTELIAAEAGVGIDKDGFDSSLAAQKQRGRDNWKGSGEKAVASLWLDLAASHGTTTFTGYDTTDDAGMIVAIVKKTGDGDGVHYEIVDHLDTGERGIVILDKTPFYGESGGQVGDTGSLGTPSVRFDVDDTTKANGLHLHHGLVRQGALAPGDVLGATIDRERREAIRRNHTATHLLHAALREVLGEHVTQKGSLVAHDRLRFDFAHHKPVSAGELAAIEAKVNHEIRKNTVTTTQVEDLESAKAAGAMALFGEKYDAAVRVVRVPGFSTELCGGTHVRATGDIGLLKITSEAGVAAGVRRIEGQSGQGALTFLNHQWDTVQKAASTLKTSPDNLLDALARVLDDRRALEREVARLGGEIAQGKAGELAGQAREVGGVRVLVARCEGDLKEQADRLRDQLGSSVIVLVSVGEDGVKLVAAASKDVAGKVHAGKIIQEIAPLVGGRGGGRPDLAQAGGKDAAGVDAAIAKAWELTAAMLGG